MRRRNPDAGLIIFWLKLKQRGYSRSYTGLYRILRKYKLAAVKPPNPKYVPKAYEQMERPGQRIQMEQHGIEHKLIRPYTPRQLKRYNYKDCNSFPMRPLCWKSPKQVLNDFLLDAVTYV